MMVYLLCLHSAAAESRHLRQEGVQWHNLVSLRGLLRGTWRFWPNDWQQTPHFETLYIVSTPMQLIHVDAALLCKLISDRAGMMLRG